jgi:hypothetical protein
MLLSRHGAHPRRAVRELHARRLAVAHHAHGRPDVRGSRPQRGVAQRDGHEPLVAVCGTVGLGSVPTRVAWARLRLPFGAQYLGERVGHLGCLVDRGTRQQDVFPAAGHGRGWREDTPDSLAVGARAHVHVGLDAANHQLRAAFQNCRGAIFACAEIVVSARGAALRLDLRHFCAHWARLRE